VKRTSYEAPHYLILSVSQSHYTSCLLVHIFSSAFCSHVSSVCVSSFGRETKFHTHKKHKECRPISMCRNVWMYCLLVNRLSWCDASCESRQLFAPLSCWCTFGELGGGFTICRIEGRSRVWAWRSCYGYHEPVGSTALDVNTEREFPEPSSGNG
jgi:hypothetical protein